MTAIAHPGPCSASSCPSRLEREPLASELNVKYTINKLEASIESLTVSLLLLATGNLTGERDMSLIKIRYGAPSIPKRLGEKNKRGKLCKKNPHKHTYTKEEEIGMRVGR